MKDLNGEPLHQKKEIKVIKKVDQTFSGLDVSVEAETADGVINFPNTQ